MRNDHGKDSHSSLFMNKYRILGKKGEGTFSEVLKAQCIKNGQLVAIKCMKNRFESIEHVNRLREIQALRRLSPFPNVIRLLEVLYDRPTGRLALVFELMEMNVYEMIRGRKQSIAEDRIINFMYQLLKSMDHMHRNGIFHRDIKPENLLVTEEVLKVADFGSCRGIYSKQPFTEYISTRWYRAPECLLTDGYYNYKMDVWGVGCVFFEILALYPLFPGNNEVDQVHKIHNVLGTPPREVLEKFRKHSNQHMNFNFPPKKGTGIAKLLPHSSPEAVDLIAKLLAYSPDERLSARQALKHPLFKSLRESERVAARMKRRSNNMRIGRDGIPASLAPVAGVDSPNLASPGHSIGKGYGDASSTITNTSSSTQSSKKTSLTQLATKKSDYSNHRIQMPYGASKGQYTSSKMSKHAGGPSNAGQGSSSNNLPMYRSNFSKYSQHSHGHGPGHGQAPPMNNKDILPAIGASGTHAHAHNQYGAGYAERSPMQGGSQLYSLRHMVNDGKSSSTTTLPKINSPKSLISAEDRELLDRLDSNGPPAASRHHRALPGAMAHLYAKPAAGTGAAAPKRQLKPLPGNQAMGNSGSTGLKPGQSSGYKNSSMYQ